MTHRNIHGEDRTPIQQGLTIDHRDYRALNVDRVMLGIVLEVHPSDSDNNRSAIQKKDRLGFTHECTVLVLNDGVSGYTILPNVVIPPDSASGLDNYEEFLPRGCTSVTTGATFDANLHQIDPNDLDGEMCVIDYIGGSLDLPYIAKWWSHPRNTFDPATSGAGAKGNTLKQSKRYFRRINGVEAVVTSKGDIIVSTHFANNKVVPGGSPKQGRFARTIDPDVGGSLRLNIKPSQTMELAFEPYTDGIGVQDRAEPEMPQHNPPQTAPKPPSRHSNTYVMVSKDILESHTPKDHILVSGERFVWESGASTKATVGTSMGVEIGTSLSISTGTTTTLSSAGNTTVTAGGVLELEGSSIKLGAAASEPVIKGLSLQTWMLGFHVSSPFGPLFANPLYASTLLLSTGSTKSTVE